MQILNKNNIPYLTPSEIQWRVSSSIVDVKLKDNDTYFLVEFFDKHSLKHLHQLILGNLKIEIQQKKIKLLLSNTHEAFSDVVYYIYKVLVFELKIPESQIVLLTEAADIDIEILNVAKKLNKTPISAEWTRIFEMSIQQQVNILNFSHQTLLSKTYNKKFLNFNRRWRLHRPVFVALLHSYKMLDKGYISLAEADDDRNWKNTFSSILDITKNSDLQQIIIKHKRQILNIDPLYLDILNLNENPVNINNESRNLYNDTYFSVVSETNFYKEHGNSQFLSEKTFKPIAEKHPFIMLNRPRSLSKLHAIGYQSFSSIINEDYDLEENDNKRIKMILSEVVRLSNLTGAELDNFLYAAREICNYNYSILKTKTEFSTKLL